MASFGDISRPRSRLYCPSDLVLGQWHTYQKSAPKTGTSKPVLVSGESDMQSGSEFFWYRFSVTTRTMLYFWCRFIPVFSYRFSAPISSTCKAQNLTAWSEDDCFNGFYRATRMHSADYAVARCPSVCPSVCLSHAGILSKQLNILSNILPQVATPF